jgi:hypothetical protein
MTKITPASPQHFRDLARASRLLLAALVREHPERFTQPTVR